MAAETQYTANTGAIVISLGNSNLDGTTGTYYNIVTGASNGTLIKKVFIKAQGSTTSDGMIRLFAYDGTNTKIITEVNVPIITNTATDPTFEAVIELNYLLKSGGILKASTENSDTFNVIAECLDWTYYGSVRPESTKYTANTGMNTPNSSNSTMTGSGTLNRDIWSIISAGSNGTIIQSITIKAQVTTTPGMIRLFLYNPSTSASFLLTEIPVPAVTKSGTAHSFSQRIDFNGKDFALQPEWSIRATTQNSEAFNVIAEGLDWVYPA